MAAILLLRVGSVVLVLAAVVLFVLAFTRFDPAPSQPGPDEAGAYEDRMTRDAQSSVLLGVAGCFTLLGAFACHEGARPKPADAAPSEPPRRDA